MQQNPATQQVRQLLVSAGLSEHEADQVMVHLSAEFASGAVRDNNDLSASLARALDPLTVDKRQQGGRSTNAKDALIALALGVAGNALWDLMKSGFNAVTQTQPEPTMEAFPEELIVECIGHFPNLTFDGCEDLLKLALQHRQRRYGRFHHQVAVSLDALAMCLDAKGHHIEATVLRERVFEIEERVAGRNQLNTGIALCNLGVNLAARSKLKESARSLVMGTKIIMDQRGTHYVGLASAAYSQVLVCERLGPSHSVYVTPEQMAAARSLTNTMLGVMQRKKLAAIVDATRECMEDLTKSAGLS